MKRIAIIGGGISGLSAAFALEQQRASGIPLEYTLFEASDRFGGVIRTERVDGCLLEAGPDSFLTEKIAASELCNEVGLSDQIIGSKDAERKTYILVDRKLIPIPEGLAFMVPTKILSSALSPLFSLSTRMKIAREWFHPRLAVENDESVSTFVGRHYGKEMVDRLADPLLSAVYGGEAANLSLRAVLPRFAEMQARHGSLGKAVIENRKRLVQSTVSKNPRSLFTSLKQGMQQLIDAILLRLPSSRLTSNAAIHSLHRHENGWTLSRGGENQHFDSVILALPAYAAAKLLNACCLDLASELGAIDYSSSVTVCLGYGKNVRSQLPPGFGFLVPRQEGKRILAATFVHNKFSHRASEDRALIRGFLGGTRDEPVVELGDDEILGIVSTELRQILGIRSEPLFTRVYRWKAAMAQYNVGHLKRLERIESLRRSQPGLILAGNAYGGIGIPDCIRSGKQAALSAI